VANAEINFDPTNKLRTSSPQALIDTDFEYGTQVSKWENLAMTNNRPFAYANPTSLAVTAMTITGRTVTVSTTSPPTVGTPVIINDSYLSIANGVFVVETVVASTSFTYTARATSSLAGGTSIFDSNKTSVTPGIYYTASQINQTNLTGTSAVGVNSITSDNSANTSKITVAMANAHGLSLGNEIQVASATTAATGALGAFYVAQVLSPTSFAYYARSQVAAAVGATADFKIYARTQGQVLHRPFDGGVIFSSNAGSNYESQIRQTRRYFRYQSGKGIQLSSGTILKPNFQIDKLSYAQSTGLITITFKDVHNIQTVPPDAQITIANANEPAFNGTYFVTNVVNYNTVTVTPTAGKFTADATASGNYYVSTSGWYGAVNRLGIFDQQNGLFFEFDGQTLYAVRRNSTYQLSGRANVVGGSTSVTVSSLATFANAVYTKQLTGGDYVVIKGQSYRVESVQNDSNFTISPAYRGATANNVIISKTIDTKMPQSQWNLDTMDGNGPSGYRLDLSKMQMFYIDYSWYGAGFIRWGLRGTNGDVLYVHKMANNNVNQEAYMRSGNLPGRYESGTIPPVTKVTNAVASTDTTITVADTSAFPSTGTLYIKDYQYVEYVYYKGKTPTTFQNVVRAQAGKGTGALPITSTTAAGSNTMTVATTDVQIGQRVIATSATALSDGTFVTAIGSGTVTLSQAALSADPSVIFVSMNDGNAKTFTPATNPVTVELAYPTLAPTISHWGTSVIMDGRFDDDKSLVFTYGQTSFTTIAAGTSKGLFSIRVAPSVDNGQIGAFGARELINRMQLTLRNLGISTKTANANMLVRAYLNGVPSSATTWTNAVGDIAGTANSSLAQIADYAAGSTTVSGGEITAGFLVAGTDRLDLLDVRDLGNSVLGGGGANSNTQIYPDGPDVLTIVVTNLGGSSIDVLGRLSWTEAQA